MLCWENVLNCWWFAHFCGVLEISVIVVGFDLNRTVTVFDWQMPNDRFCEKMAHIVQQKHKKKQIRSLHDISVGNKKI